MSITDAIDVSLFHPTRLWVTSEQCHIRWTFAIGKNVGELSIELGKCSEGNFTWLMTRQKSHRDGFRFFKLPFLSESSVQTLRPIRKHYFSFPFPNVVQLLWNYSLEFIESG